MPSVEVHFGNLLGIELFFGYIALFFVLLTRLGNSLSNYMILLVQEIDIANLGEIYHLDPSGGSRDAENPEEPS